MIPQDSFINDVDSQNAFNFLQEDINFDDNNRSQNSEGPNFPDFSHRHSEGFLVLTTNQDKKEEGVHSDKKLSNFDPINKPSESKYEHEELHPPNSPIIETRKPISEAHPNVSNQTQEVPKQIPATLQKREPLPPPKSVSREGFEEKEDMSQYSNTQDNEIHSERRYKRSARHRKNPKIFRDEYVTSMTGKRKVQQQDSESKSNDNLSCANKKTPGRKRKNKIEVSVEAPTHYFTIG